jgi:cardiolipin synthase
VEDKYRENSRELELGAWLARPLRERALDNLARLTSMLQ